MSLEIHHISLREALAYEFYLENIAGTLDAAKTNGTTFEEAVVKLAKSSFVIADIFLEASSQPTLFNQTENNDLSTND